MVLEGERTVASVAREFDINASTLGSWVNRHRIVSTHDEQRLVPGPERARIRELERENAELREKLTTVLKSAQPWVATLVRTIFDQPTSEAVRAQHTWVIDALEAKYPAACEHLDAAREELLAFAAFPREIWRQIWGSP